MSAVGRCLKRSVGVAALGLVLATRAFAQPAQGPSQGYAEFVVQSAFGNVTSQSFGAEIGYAIKDDVLVFADVGLARDTASAALSAKAQAIAGGITAAAGTASYGVKQPVTFGVVGVKYLLPTTHAHIEPYVLGGGGAARVSRDVTFSTPAGNIGQFVTLGGDLSGKTTHGMLSVGGGVGIRMWPAVMIDLQYRYGRVFVSGDGLNLSRAGIGIGVRF